MSVIYLLLKEKEKKNKKKKHAEFSKEEISQISRDFKEEILQETSP